MPTFFWIEAVPTATKLSFNRKEREQLWMRQVDEILNLIIETVMCKNDKILIASNWYPASLVKKKFLMLTYSHIEYVLHCMSGNTTKVKNIKKYLLAALFNAPSTMNGYYQAEVNHDMPGLAR
nr:DUF6017 domain-containing protein [[Ruminococcus] torques]